MLLYNINKNSSASCTWSVPIIMSTKDSYCDNDVELLTMSCIPLYRGPLSYAK